MLENKYKALNEVAEYGGIVIFGGSEETTIPLGELRQAFAIKSKIYNRSFSELSIIDAIEIYDEYIKSLHPEVILLHIGSADIDYFTSSQAEFDRKYRDLICHIKKTNKKTRIAIISLKNFVEDRTIHELNKHLKVIAETEQCEYGDISSRMVWNPKETKDVLSFVYSIGFVQPLKIERPLYDLIKILYFYDSSYN